MSSLKTLAVMVALKDQLEIVKAEYDARMAETNKAVKSMAQQFDERESKHSDALVCVNRDVEERAESDLFYSTAIYNATAKFIAVNYGFTASSVGGLVSVVSSCAAVVADYAKWTCSFLPYPGVANTAVPAIEGSKPIEVAVPA